MASIDTYLTKSGQTMYRARVQRKGFKTQTAAFPSLREARKWATMIEGQIIAGRHFPESISKKHTLAELLARYDREIVPTLAPSTQRTQRQRLSFWHQRLGRVDEFTI
jgi:hypothetical protein